MFASLIAAQLREKLHGPPLARVADYKCLIPNEQSRISGLKSLSLLALKSYQQYLPQLSNWS